MKAIVIFCSLLVGTLNAKAYMVYGESAPLGQGEVKVFADIDQNGKPSSVGFAVSEAAVESVGADPADIVLKLPSVLNIPPYNHMTIEWNPQGHEPDGVYNLPHFDFHFYFISESLRSSITCSGDDREVCLLQPDADSIPPFYVPTPEGVPHMGWHWLDSRSPELNGEKFTATFIYGFYDGMMNFMEPMITREFIMKKEKFEQAISVPAIFPYSGYYPASYSVEFDTSLGMYLVKLNSLQYTE